MVNDIILRSQSQAEYAPDNIGHFGLSLRRYCHFTSPIRRYADLLVHRALISGLDLGEGALEKNHQDFCRLGEILSKNERRASAAERDAVDRFCAFYLSGKIGAIFNGRINGVARFGLFVTLDDTGADGLVPIRSLGVDYFVHDEARHLLRGRSTKQTFRLGDKVQVMLKEADPTSGSMIMNLVNSQDSQSPAKTSSKLNIGKNKKKITLKKSKSKSKAGRRKARIKS
jgi:ribonuclease R